ncbi:GNAT family N-acetyltransferase [Cellulomonas sp. PhB143]|uniref:GNAT family N-acetyltransferase n=1 Tax=Cellulomonas sp. PhB143 TaxID=2485186 RepID=UPI000F46C097|nr:N-acetyltransferase [Cellulomonas sp. PhB143]ROS78410.1 ribosomal protein S18 acetylase RimI-like enzyme [Cellulomonas sp. PhB143]
MNHRTRPATADDVPDLVRVAALTFPLACPPGADPAAVAEHVRTQLGADRFAAWASSPDHALLVVEDADRRTVGYALLARGPVDDPEVAALVGLGTRVELSKIYVDPAAQGTGAAGALMREALGVARERLGARDVWLGTNGENARAQAFYRKHGFATVGSRRYVVGGETHDDVVMVLAER